MLDAYLGKNDTKTGTKNKTRKKYQNILKKIAPLAPPGGGPIFTFLMCFCIRAPSGSKWCPRCLKGVAQGCPGVPRATPSTIFYYFWSLWGGFWCDLGYIWVFQWVSKPWLGTVVGSPKASGYIHEYARVKTAKSQVALGTSHLTKSGPYSWECVRHKFSNPTGKTFINLCSVDFPTQTRETVKLPERQ